MVETGVAATFTYRHEAEFARETLRAAGIDSVLAGDDAGGAYSPLGFTRGMRLLVRREDLERARELLSEEGDGASDRSSGPA